MQAQLFGSLTHRYQRIAIQIALPFQNLLSQVDSYHAVLQAVQPHFIFLFIYLFHVFLLVGG